MVKKLKSLSQEKLQAAAGLLDGQLAQSVRDSAQQIWLAGMARLRKPRAKAATCSPRW